MRMRQFGSQISPALLILLLATTVQAGGATFILQPVAPKTVPPSDYPPGTTIVGQEIILGSVPARVWLEIHVTGWAPEEAENCTCKAQSIW